MNVAKLHDAVAAVAPIDGVHVGRRDDRSTWRIDFRPEATDEQRADGQAVMDAFDPLAADPRTATALQLRYALNALGWRTKWDAAVALQSQSARDYWETEPNPPETSPKLKRIAAAAGVDLKSIFDLSTA